VIVEPAHAHQLAPLIAEAYGLNERERAVTQLVARGLSTSQIASRLYLSPYTVQDHLKSIFDKVVSERGVSSPLGCSSTTTRPDSRPGIARIDASEDSAVGELANPAAD
jgi:DNA-binding CsgD family transcriptional regulator